MSNKVLVLSIKPEYAQKIFDGTKTIELRRVRPQIKKGDIVLVYVSSPMKRLVGVFKVNKIISGQPQDLWEKIYSEAGITYEKYTEYFSGALTAYGICFFDVRLLPEPIPLHMIKELWPEFHPPQSYCYINRFQNDRILSYVTGQMQQFLGSGNF